MPQSPDASSMLTRQLRQLCLQPDQPPPDRQQWLALLDTIGRTYEDFEQQIALVMREQAPTWADTVREDPESDAEAEADPSAATWTWQPGDEALHISAGLAQLLRLPPGTRDLPLTVWLACLDDSDRELQCEYLMQVAQQPMSLAGQLRCTPPHGNGQRWLHYELRSDAPHDPAEPPPAVHCQLLDISSRMRAEESLHGSAGQDELTGLHNRSRLFDLAASARARAERDASQVGLLCMDVDGFRHLNEAYGHDTGDRLLRGIAQRLRSTVRLGDQIGRLAGDEFLLLVHPVESVQHLEAIAYKIQAAIAVPMEIGGEAISLSLSVGIAVHPQDATSTLDLVRAASRALRAAKQRGPGACIIHELLPPPPNPLARRSRSAAAV